VQYVRIGRQIARDGRRFTRSARRLVAASTHYLFPSRRGLPSGNHRQSVGRKLTECAAQLANCHEPAGRGESCPAAMSSWAKCAQS
jgi:hypothetical protein